MKKVISLIICAALFLCGCGNAAPAPDGALARVGDEYIYEETIEADRLLGMAGSDREIVESKLLNMLIFLEAVDKGLAATEEETEQFMSSQEKAWQTPGVKEQIEAMYEPLGIDFEEYKAMLTELAPRTLARQKLRDFYGREYCEKHGLEFTKVNPPAEMEAYIEKQLDKLWDKYKGQYEIYIG